MGGVVVENLAKIEEQLEAARTRLNKEIEKSNGTENTSENVLKLSRELDELILKYQKMLNKD
ncbi:MAG: aspartyl-phosphate phosphatase Spo0E family protein [Clostridiales bacterium]|nr:aspartyl-phosphate phosphatase Spo0E family protein [Clostridiales bacterium]